MAVFRCLCRRSCLSGPPSDQTRSAMTPAASFRDPAGSVVVEADRVLRYVNAAGSYNLDAYIRSAKIQKMVGEGRVEGAREVSRNDREVVLEHDKVPFVSYAHEWPAEMLYAAAALTLEIAEEILDDGVGLKDA